MIEIIALILLCKSIGNRAHAKGLSPKKYQCLLVGLWLSCELLALLGLFTIVDMWRYSPNESLLLMLLFGLGGAIAGAIAAFWAVERAEPNVELARCRRERHRGPRRRRPFAKYSSTPVSLPESG